MSDRNAVILVALAVGAISGMRSMSAPAAVTSRVGPRWLHRVALAMAAGEMAADKTSLVGNRTEPTSLAGRMALGGASAGLVAHAAGESIVLAVSVGAAAAAGATYLSFHIRRLLAQKTPIPDVAVALAEDALVVASARAVVDRIPAR